MQKRFVGMWILGLVAGLLLAVNTPWNIHAEEKLTNGTCGESATWEYNTQTKTLTIRGTGVVSRGNFQENDWFCENGNFLWTAKKGTCKRNFLCVKNGFE